MPPKAKKAAPAAADAKIDDAPKEGKAGRPRFPDWNSYERLAVTMAAMDTASALNCYQLCSDLHLWASYVYLLWISHEGRCKSEHS